MNIYLLIERLRDEIESETNLPLETIASMTDKLDDLTVMIENLNI